MHERKGEKIGWIGGWFGSFLWVFLLAGVRLFQNHPEQGVTGLLLACAAFALILRLSPWRWPHTRYWKLMLPIYTLLVASIFWALWTFDAFAYMGSHWWSLLPILPGFTPLATMGRRTWNSLPASRG